MKAHVGIVGLAHVNLAPSILSLFSCFGLGDNSGGQLTEPSGTIVTEFKGMIGLPGGIIATKCYGGNADTVIIGSDGKPYAAGWNNGSMLTGTGDRASLTPMAGLPNGVTAVKCEAGANTSFIIGSDGIPYGAGWNDYSELATSYGGDLLYPMDGLPLDVTAVSCKAVYHNTYVFGSDGILYGCGRNSYNEVSPITGTVDVLTPINNIVGGVAYGIDKWSAGDRHLVAILK